MLNNLLQSFNQNNLLKNQLTHINKTFAGMIDFLLILPLRIAIVSIYLQPKINVFLQDFSAKFGNKITEETPEHLQFFAQHPIYGQMFLAIFIFIGIGLIYNIYFHSSNWQATIGKRLLKIIVNNKNNQKLTILHSIKYYFINNLSIIYATFLFINLAKSKSNIYQIITGNIYFLAGGAFLIFSFYYGLFSKQKLSFLDLLADTRFASGRTNYKFPWSK